MPVHGSTDGELDLPSAGDPDLDWDVVGPGLDWDLQPIEPPLPGAADFLSPASREELDDVEAVLGAAGDDALSWLTGEREQVLLTVRAMTGVVAGLSGAEALGRLEVALQRLWDEPGFRRPLLSRSARSGPSPALAEPPAAAEQPAVVDLQVVPSPPFEAPLPSETASVTEPVPLLPVEPEHHLAPEPVLVAQQTPVAAAEQPGGEQPVGAESLLPDVEPEPALRSSLAAAASVLTVRAAAAPIGVDASGRVLPVPAAPETPQPPRRPKRGLRLPVGRGGAPRRGKP